MRALLVEDEEKLSELIVRNLKDEGFAVDSAMDGRHGLDMASSYPYDVIILDIMLPQMSGTEVLTHIRTQNRQVPIIMLTARDSLSDKVTHFEGGADDYLTKPFKFSELLVRIRALLRRTATQRDDVIKVGDMDINRMTRLVTRSGRRIDLSVKEYGLLEYLALNKGRVLSRSMIIEHVWDQSFEGFSNIVDAFIRQLRKKVDADYEKKLIRTVRGVGYSIGD